MWYSKYSIALAMPSVSFTNLKQADISPPHLGILPNVLILLNKLSRFLLIHLAFSQRMAFHPPYFSFQHIFTSLQPINFHLQNLISPNLSIFIISKISFWNILSSSIGIVKVLAIFDSLNIQATTEYPKYMQHYIWLSSQICA